VSDDAKIAPDLIETVIAKGNTEGISSLNPPQQVVFLIAELDTAVLMEGLLGYYSNSTGAYAVQVAGALELIGAQTSAALIREANSRFPSSLPPLDWEERRKALSELTDEEAERIEVLGNRFSDYPDELGEKFERFVIANQGELAA
jgi:hypothetical protein